MANNYFNWVTSLRRFVRFDAARAEDVNDALDELSAGLDVLQGDVNRSLKLPTSTADQTLALTAGQRANLVVSFDAAGNITAIQGGFAYRGDWVTATQYVKNDVVRDAASKNLYVCLVAHTSGTLADDITAGKFGLAINVADVEAAKTAAQTAATNAATSEANALTYKNAAGTSATNAATSEGNATAAAAAATTAYDSFDDRYLGPKAANPTLDNDGNALLTGALYWNTGANEMRVWTGSAWIATFLPATGYAVLGANTFTGTQTGGDNALVQWLVRDIGYTANNKGSQSTGTQTFDYTLGSAGSITIAGALTIAVSNWPPTGNLGMLLLEITNGGSASVTLPTVNWLKPDGTTTTTFSAYLTAAGRASLQTAGTDQLLIWTRDGGATLYGKLL